MPKVFVTGDTHGGFRRVYEFCKTHNTATEDIMIILGDAGINYFGDERDERLKRALDEVPIRLFCVHGNHEMRPQTISTYQIQSIDSPCLSGKVYAEPTHPNLLFAVDGEVYNFQGQRGIVAGGAYSVDKHYRIARGARWFQDEQPSDLIKQKVEARLDELNNKIDLVLTHTCPAKYIPTEMFLPCVDQLTVDNSTEIWLDTIEDRLDYSLWLCGHYHTDKHIDRIRFMYDDIIELEGL